MYAFIKSANPWLDEHIKSCVRKYVPGVTFVDDIADLRPENVGGKTVFQFGDGENLGPKFAIANTAAGGLINAYPSSDALARKDCLARVVEYWTAKRPGSILKDTVPVTVRLSLDYSEYVDEALAAADDLTLLYSLEENEEKDAADREWWILKPALLDCGSGIRIFSTMEELASHLELAADLPCEDEGEEEQAQEPEGDSRTTKGEATYGDRNGAGVFSPELSFPGLASLDALVTTTSEMSLNSGIPGKAQKDAEARQYVSEDTGRILSAQIREFVAQRYIVSVPPLENRKWHVRAYVLSVGRLKVHVFREMLALLALEDHKPPWDDPKPGSFLTNTAIQDEGGYVAKRSMRDFWSTPDDLLPGEWKARAFDQICEISAELFRAAAYTMADKFTALDQCFELYALDFLIDTEGTAWLLEVNETPAFYEQGVAAGIAQRLLESVICVVMEHLGRAQVGDHQDSELRKRMVEVVDETEKLGKSNISEIIPEY
ncbi:hypothetical protein SLS62_000389 [Diatrype stigma]|uniref:Uncharacterized protein n=1 Tax=Diatrype stigma TaxID=117547 RepID=A0AAN9V1L3_9PEZI